MLITLDQIIRYLNIFGLQVNSIYLTYFEESILFIVGNILWILFLLFWFILIWKVFSRLVNSLF